VKIQLQFVKKLRVFEAATFRILIERVRNVAYRENISVPRQAYRQTA
jgi:hypothetical protein